MESVQAIGQRLHVFPYLLVNSANPHEQLVESAVYEENENEEEQDFMKNAGSNRSRTDIGFLILHGIVTFSLLFFVCYCIAYGDIERIIKGHDDCGNVCGKQNDFDIYNAHFCKPLDMTKKPYLRIDQSFQRTCVEYCPNGEENIGHFCVAPGIAIHNMEKNFEGFLKQAAKDLNRCSGDIAALIFFSIGFSFCMYLVLRYMTAIFVWATVYVLVVGCIAITAFFWYLTSTSDGFTIPAITCSILTFVVIIVVIVMTKRIKFVIRLLKEAGQSISALPWILLEPILTIVSLMAIWIGYVYFAIWIESAGFAIENNGGVYFLKNGVMNFTRWYNLLVLLWMVQFIYGCQTMLISGAISAWYFIRNKSKLSSPIYNSARNMIKYHLGTISFGSLIIALIQIIRILIRSLRRPIHRLSFLLYLCCINNQIETCLTYLETAIKYFTKNVYIVTSIHGYPFLESGSKAFSLLVNNAFNVLAINSIGNTVLLLAKAIIIAASIGLSIVIFKDKAHVEFITVPIIFVAIISLIIAHCFITVYEIAIDTIFICFCEDCELNDGTTQPYYMSSKLMKFVQDSNDTSATVATPQ